MDKEYAKDLAAATIFGALAGLGTVIAVVMGIVAHSYFS